MLRIDLITADMTEVAGRYGSPAEVFPLPSGDRLAYWVVDSAAEQSLIINEGGQESTSDLAPQQFDYAGKLLFSPNGQKLCYESGSSGYFGYTIVDVTSSQVIATGNQYSYCRRWLDDEKITVLDRPYATGVLLWSVLDATTGEQTVFDHARYE